MDVQGLAICMAGPVDGGLLWQKGRPRRQVLEDVVKRLGFSYAQRGFT